MKTETPRTDDLNRVALGGYTEMVEHARTLERELANMTAHADRLGAANDRLVMENTALRAELGNLRQQVASATADVSVLRSEKLQLEDARRGDMRCIVSLNEPNERLALALMDAVSTFREDDVSTIVTAERQGAWKNALESWQQYKLDHPTP